MTINLSTSAPPTQGQPIVRPVFLAILNAALSKEVNEFRFARQSALQWLAVYPGDLQVSLSYAKALIGEQRLAEARSVLKGLSMADPENKESLQLWIALERGSKGTPNNLPDLNNWAAALDGRSVPAAAPDSKGSPAWGEQLYAVRKSLQAGDLDAAQQELPSLLGISTESPLLALTHLQIMAADPAAPLPARRSLGEFYHRRWPDCLACSLLLGSWWIQEGSTERGVALLHQTAGRDLSGQIARRALGENHPYRSLWSDNLAITAELMIPARVAAALGWNQLSPGTTIVSPEGAVIITAQLQQTENSLAPAAVAGIAAAAEMRDNDNPAEDKTPDEDIVRFSAELDRMAAALDEQPASQYDGRFPVYVIFSVHSRLAAQYGAQGAADLETEMKQLAQTISQRQTASKRSRWGATVFLPDQPESSAAHGLAPLQAIDPWSLKLSLVDLDHALAKHGEMIGALLIVGGPEIVPFHNLPNPIEDPDSEVPSDNPYSTLDENYFIPEWPVGRIPGETGRDYSLLSSNLRRIQEKHAADPKAGSPKRWLGWITRWLKPTQRQYRKGFGYTAEVWRNASFQVYRPVGESKAVMISPPGSNNGHSGNGSQNALPAARLGYFNLHGLADAPEWYGQRDPQTTSEGPDYPVALRPEDLRSLGEKIPQVIFSEACYGANIQGKTRDQALSLKFLESGTQIVAGSTTMSYGAMNAPLIAADLLGYNFWKGLLEGLTAGEALQRAKIHLASEMHQRQGYLDGEDQKTLISFVLYGDPLTRLPEEIRQAKTHGNGTLRRLVGRPPIFRTANSNQPSAVNVQGKENNDPGSGGQVPDDVMVYVKQIVASYLPGMMDAQATYSEERPERLGQAQTGPTDPVTRHDIPPGGKRGSAKRKSGRGANTADASKQKNQPRHVVVLNKSLQKGGYTHHQFARLTLDSSGKLVKIVVSR